MSTQPISDLDLDWTFGDRVRKIRRASGDSQETFAQRIGQKKESLAAWETGRNAQPRGVVAIARRIELAYGVPAVWTLGLETQQGPHPEGPDGGHVAPPTGLEPVTLCFAELPSQSPVHRLQIAA